MGLKKWGMERWMKGLQNGLLLIDGVIDQKRPIQHYRQIKLKDWVIGQPAVCLEINYRTDYKKVQIKNAITVKNM